VRRRAHVKELPPLMLLPAEAFLRFQIFINRRPIEADWMHIVLPHYFNGCTENVSDELYILG